MKIQGGVGVVSLDELQQTPTTHDEEGFEIEWLKDVKNKWLHCKNNFALVGKQRLRLIPGIKRWTEHWTSRSTNLLKKWFKLTDPRGLVPLKSSQINEVTFVTIV